MTHQRVSHIEKFKTITTEVFALTLGLGAFSLTTIPRENLFDVIGVVATFAMIFFYIIIIWLVNSRFFDEYPLHDEVFLGLCGSFSRRHFSVLVAVNLFFTSAQR